MKLLKEIVIIAALVVLIILILVIIFYDYIPTNKFIPVPVKYVGNEVVEQELSEILSGENEKVLVTYELDEGDLKSFTSTNKINPGKVNPFSNYGSGNGSGGDVNIDGNSSNNSNGNFFDNGSTK